MESTKKSKLASVVRCHIKEVVACGPPIGPHIDINETEIDAIVEEVVELTLKEIDSKVRGRLIEHMRKQFLASKKTTD